MSNNKYSNIGKKQIIKVISQVIQKVEAMEMTLHFLIMYTEKDNISGVDVTFEEFMQDKLKGDENELQSDETADGKGNNSNSNENS